MPLANSASMLLRQLYDRETFTYSYLLADEDTREAVLIDPVREQVERDLQLLDELGLRLVHVIETHVHADHVTAAGILRARTGATTIAGRRGAPCADVHVGDGDVIRFGRHALTVLETPGHTDDSLSFAAGPETGGMVFTGDTLFVRGTGRADFQNGDPSALWESITHKLFALHDDTVVWPGHDYRGLTSTTIGEEKHHNPRLAGKTREEFVAIMNGLGLPAPKKLDEAVPANRRCGEAAIA